MTVFGQNNDKAGYAPYIERKHKLEPCPAIGTESTDKTSFYSQVKVQPRYEYGHGIKGNLIVAVGLDDIGIEDEPIQSPFRHCQIEDFDEEYEDDTSYSIWQKKENGIT